MANKSIPVKDKQLVLRRLAEGLSTRQAIQGTAVASNQTAARLAKRQSHAMRQYRRDYLAMIETTSQASSHERAAMLGQMVWATKTIRVTLPADPGRFMPVKRRDVFIEVEDWATRLKAIQYIDRLAGINPGPAPAQLNVLQQVNGRL